MLSDIFKHRDGFGDLSPEIIYMSYPSAICCICGKEDLSKWGIPIDMETALVCSNDFEGDWAAKPACHECWTKHGEGQLVGHDPRY